MRPIARAVGVFACSLALACDRPEAPPPVAPAEARTAASTSPYVGAATCAECHAAEATAWRGSHHDRAMEPARADTVLGDFADARFEAHGVASAFRRRGDAFLIETEGEDGARAEHEVKYTFGVAPLQQYLVAQDGGRLQAFGVAWDTERRRWFSLYPDERIPPGDALHWTGRYQRWNAMCADCHSTDLRRGYDAATDRYDTTWAELDVACEACHGPGAAHVAWARDPGSSRGAHGLPVPFDSASAEVESCAPCHSRRARIRAEPVWNRPLHDSYLPSLLEPGLYHPDGQIDGEVYEHGSFVQSRMYRAGVRCSDCHEPHSAGLRAEGDALCVRCHQTQPDARFPTLRAKSYDTPDHHHHEAGSTGSSCVGCHMPTKSYMIVDPRRDHSLRIPRPDLSAKLGTPNACNQCHADRSPEWAAQAVGRWFGPGRQKVPHFGEALALERAGDPAAQAALQALARDPEQPAIARATAVGRLDATQPAAHDALRAAAADASPWLRTAAAGALDFAPRELALELGLPLLADPILAVRIEAARVLAAQPQESLAPDARARLERALAEFDAAQRVSADLPGAQLNLGIVAATLGRGGEAETAYRRALAMDPDFLPARFNLAVLLNALQRNDDAARVLRDGIARAPDEGELHYSLGLLLAEQRDWPGAVAALARAAELLPTRPRVRENLRLAEAELARRGGAPEAELPPVR